MLKFLGFGHLSVRRMLPLALVFLAAFACFAPAASAQTRSLKLYYLHTGEKDTIVYKRNGKFDPAGLKKINWFLRDWRRNEPTKMDPNLLDLVWEAYRQSGSRDYIHVISGYRSPASNNLLRSRGRGVAKNSQHTHGKAMDFFLPDVKLSKLREIGLKLQVGGVGYYPTSGSPFVHLDTGSVRHWPRMTRTELAKVFPDGKTMHIPTDGKPLAKYEVALAEYKRRTAKGDLVPGSKSTGNELTFFQRLAGMTKEDQADDEENNTAPAPRAVATTTTPPPADEPADSNATTEFASLPSQVPVPSLAPRGQNLDSGAPVTIASLSQETVPATDLATIAEPQDEPTATSENPFATFASASLPVPLRRPENEVQIASTADQGQSTSELAMLEPAAPAEKPEGGRIEVTALTPAEIEDLRRLARPSIASTAPVPAANVGNTEVVNAPQDTTKPGSPTPEGTLANVVVASLAPVESANAAVPVPLPKPTAENIAGDITDSTGALEPIEPGVKSTGVPAIPVQNPQMPVENIMTAATPTPTPEPASLDAKAPVLAKLPVPVKNPRSEIVLASLQPAPASENSAPVAQLPKRTISLDALSAPEENTTSLGQWALSTDHTIQDLAEVQAPAYGRNVIRTVEPTIIKQGFSTQPFVLANNGFVGKAVTAMKFAKLQIR
jgi:uncharacterized protein YcbK (DUF882 family)